MWREDLGYSLSSAPNCSYGTTCPATLLLRPLMFALALLPLVFGTVTFALFGVGWIILSLNLGNVPKRRNYGQP